MLPVLQRIPTPFPQKSLSVSETAYLLNCSDQTVYKLIKSKDLKAYKISPHGYWRVLVESIYDYQTSKIVDDYAKKLGNPE
ncbi:MAG: helix-turn-helix domain-containing protein [Selenomonadaceae bacterium]|nr:helix-turn-helix domain-containing protein [Selenomonadaceae bacterium]